jgi:transposase InsO family protein
MATGKPTDPKLKAEILDKIWKLGLRHSSDLTYTALLDALSRHRVPAILHSDQGSEYLSYKHQKLCERLEIQLSASAKASPWQNGYMERFFGTLKDELPPLGTLKSTEQLHEVIALTIHYYNHRRRHGALAATQVKRQGV